MLDSTIRKPYQKLMVDPILGSLTRLHPNVITLLGALFGVAVIPLLTLHHSMIAFGALALSGYFDTLDGSLARKRGTSSNVGAALDIVCDRAVEFSVILGLFLYDPTRALPALLMLGASFLCVTSFLVVGVFTENDSDKSFHYSPGLIERGEAFLFFGLMILWPKGFIPLAWLYSILVFATALLRMIQFVGYASYTKEPPHANTD